MIWKPKEKNYKAINEAIHRSSKKIKINEFENPLYSKEESVKKSTNEDPLNIFGDESQTESINITGQLNRSIQFRTNNRYLNWGSKKADYLKKYTTNQNIPVVSKIMEEGDDSNKVITVEDRVKMRLDKLKDEKEEDVKVMSQNNVINMLENLNVELGDAWNVQKNRVASLKIAIKCTKMLARNSVPQFYPSLCVLVFQILDQFGELVYKRIVEKSKEYDDDGKLISKLPTQFTAADVPQSAMEICRNWFFKISSIRELIARVFSEMSIIRNYKFLYDSDEAVLAEFVRIGDTIRGIGDPLVAAYARCYLARKCYEMYPKHPNFIYRLLSDTLTTWNNQVNHMSEYFKKIGVTAGQYEDLFQPAIEWFMEMLGNEADAKLLTRVLKLYNRRGLKSNLLLTAIIASFPGPLVSNNASILVDFIQNSNDQACSKHKAFTALGMKFCVKPPVEAERMTMLNTIWQHVTKVEDLKEYLEAAEVFVEYVTRNFSLKEVNILIRDVHAHIENSEVMKLSHEDDENDEGKDSQEVQDYLENQKKFREEIEGILKNILLAILEHAKDFVQVFNMTYFLPIFDVLSTNIRAEVAKGMLSAFSRRTTPVSDPVIINSLFDLAKTVHDSVTIFSPSDTRTEVSNVVSKFLTLVNYGTQYDKHLSFLVDCRKSFPNFDGIKETLIQQSVFLGINTFRAMERTGSTSVTSSRTKTFVKSCIAFGHITVPSISNLFLRIRLYMFVIQLSLLTNILPPAESMMVCLIDDIKKIKAIDLGDENQIRSNEPMLVDLLSQLGSLLVCFPGHPTKGPFHILERLLMTIKEFQWDSHSMAPLKIYVNLLRVLSTYYQKKLPYNFPLVISNVELFGNLDSIRSGVEKLYNSILNTCVDMLKDVKEKSKDISTPEHLTEGALLLINTLLTDASIPSEEHQQYIRNLWKDYVTQPTPFFHNTQAALRKQGITI
mmetsp:Transcript_6803/g.9916  ORF Transcript_6803/g.9916 Transcript_6803/m.9916 type:complete len:950 (+) Transcript_6803:3342-6191(+)